MAKNKFLLTLMLRFSLVFVLWLLVTLPWFLVTPAYAGWYSGGAGTYQYRKLITIDKTKVSGSGTLPNFPLLISSTDTDLKTTGNGGKVTNSSGYDIIFTSSDGTTKLDHEIESYTGSSGEFIGWVRVPVLTTASNTTLWMYFGNSSISTSQENKTGVWDSNFKAVWHLKDGTTLSAVDTKGGNNGTISGAIAGTGQLDGAASFDGSEDIIETTATVFNSLSAVTVETWIRPSTQGGVLVGGGITGVIVGSLCICRRALS